MRLAIFSDIHSNPFALRAVLEDIHTKQPDALLCAGDIFGYYPWAQETFALLQPLQVQAVTGNHDQLVLATLGLAQDKSSSQRPSYYEAARCNGVALSVDARDWLKHLPMKTALTAGAWSISMVHGTPNDPLEGRLYPDNKDPHDWLPQHNQILILGHTHHPIIRQTDSGGMLLNPGSIGQPRDGNPKPSWILLNLTVHANAELRRVSYDVHEPIAKLRQLNWPDRFIGALNKKNPGPLTA